MGFVPAWLGENASASVQTGKLKQLTLKAKKLAVYWEVTRELAQDNVGLTAALTTQLPRVMAAAFDEAFLAGSGVNSPLGIINAGASKVITRAGANAISYADVTNMFSALHPRSMKRAVWIASASTLPSLFSMVDGASHRLWYPGMAGNAAVDPVPTSLLGRPLYFCDSAPTLGSKGDLVLADLGFYVIGLRQGIQVDTSTGPGWERDVVSYRIVARLDAEPMLSTPIKLRNGSEVSPFVVLE
jgi:HK97 family phage major capsid protein